MSAHLNEVIRQSATRLGEHIEKHRSSSQVTLSEHVRWVRAERTRGVASKRMIYLDTNAWKCLADHHQSKPRLTPAMSAFALAMNKARESRNFIFPIGLSTFFELDSMTSQETHDALVSFVDELSLGYCLAPFPERIGQELDQLKSRKFNVREDLSDFLRSPIELLGVPTAALNLQSPTFVDKETFNKAFYDMLVELPFSLQLEVARSAPGPKWDNSRGTNELNEGKKEHQEEVANLNTGIFLELKGCIQAWCIAEGVNLDPREVGLLALDAQYHWQQLPSSMMFPTMRILSSLYGLMRFDPQRRYQDGDPNDFLVASTALPVAEALFTDRRLAILLSDTRIGLSQFTDCAVISGFEEMASYIARAL